jgi:hypothetical protein
VSGAVPPFCLCLLGVQKDKLTLPFHVCYQVLGYYSAVLEGKT